MIVSMNGKNILESKVQTLKLTLQSKSPLASDLQSDTIFGQFCWVYRYLYGEKKLEETISSFEENPFIVFSNGFPEDHIPVPISKPSSIDGFENFEDYTNGKKIKKMAFIKAELLKDHQSVLKAAELQKLLLELIEKGNDSNTVQFKNQIILRNSINRKTNTTIEGGLYQTEEVFYSKDAKIDIYAKYNETVIDDSEIKTVFENIGSMGFGKDKSIGKGRFKIANVEKSPSILQERQTHTFISLSNGLPCEDSEVLFGKTFTKFGKHGGYGLKNPFKNPVILFKAGSIFKINRFKPIFGRGLSLSFEKNHKHNAYLLPLFIDVEEG